MSNKAEAHGESAANSRVNLDVPKWGVAAVVLVAGLYAYHHFGQYPAVYRALALLPVVGLSLFVVSVTSQGVAFWNLLREATVEIRRVTWPTRQETVQTTLVVFGVVFVMSFILWGLDAAFARLVALFVG